jgi:peptidoglycan-associated lipoprotein
MLKPIRTLFRSRALALIPGLLVVTGCAHVNRDEMNSRLGQLEAELRQDMSAGDAALAGQISGLDGRVTDLEARTDRLEAELQELAAEYNATLVRLADALHFNMPVHFAFDSADLTADQLRILDRFAWVVQENYPGYVITVEGFTDSVGSQEYNQALGLRRAEAVKRYLTQETGLAADRVRAVSYGEASNRLINPEARGPGESGRENRRVSLVVEYADS